MANSGKGIGIIALMIGIAAFSLGLWPIIFPSITGPSEGSLTLVALWEDLDENKDYSPYTDDDDWLIELEDNQYIDSDHISLSQGNTRFTLLKEGFYKINLRLILAQISPDSIYWIDLLRNTTFVQCFERIVANDDVYNQYYHSSSSLYINSSSIDYFMIRVHCSSDPYIVVPVDGYEFNQLSIEYVN